MMQPSYDAIVIGVGAMGSSACFHLASRGRRVLGLEQFNIPHDRGSSHGHSRMIRKAYFEHPNYVPLLERSYALWDELEAISTRRLLYRVGGVYIGPLEGKLVHGSVEAASRHHLPHDLLTSDELKRRWPQFQVPDDWHALVEPDAGFLLPEDVISVYAQHAMLRGAEIHAVEALKDWEVTGDHVHIRTDRGEYSAEHLIFTAGAWTQKLVAQLGVELKVTRQPLGWVWPSEPELFRLGKIPVWAIDIPGEHSGIYYGFPMHDESLGMKLARHEVTPAAVDPDHLNRNVEADDEQGIRGALQYLPYATGPLLAVRICMYTNTCDGHFLIDQLPENPRVHVACGFSGHGFKFASVVGEILADYVTDGHTKHPADFLRLDRATLIKQACK
jgi:sarcosine oxidase